MSHASTFLISHVSTVYVEKTVYMLSETQRNAAYLSNEHTLSISTLALLKVGEMFLSYRSTMYFIFLRICKSNRSVLQTTLLKGFCHILQLLQLWKTSPDPDIYTSWFLASSLQDSDNTISVFFAVEKQTGLWTDHYINSFLKGGSYFKKGWRNAKRDLNFNLNLFQQVKGSFERGFQQRWWYLKVINKHLNLQWKTVILLLSSVGEELGLLWSHPKNKNK